MKILNFMVLMLAGALIFTAFKPHDAIRAADRKRR